MSANGIPLGGKSDHVTCLERALDGRSLFSGLISRRLLKPVNGGNYAAIVEFKDQAAFQAMHNSPTHDEAGDQVRPLFNGKPTPTFYQVIAG
jgi:heme-degrading monooxygenase HmoA